MSLIPVVVLVEVPDEVGDPIAIAESAVRSSVQHELPGQLGYGANVRLLNGSYAFCRFHAVGEVNSMIRDARLLSVVATSPRSFSYPPDKENHD